MTATAGSLFSGVGGLDLGLERAGWRVRWQSEIDPYACRVLAKHWPHVPNLGDVTTIDWSTVEHVDLICGGFPCPDISSAHTNGVRAGLAGARSGLWSHFAAAIEALRPRWAVIENSPEWKRWVPDVRSQLDLMGYASVPLLLPAGSFGAPHRRPRVLVVADAHGEGESLGAIHAEVARLRPDARGGGPWSAGPPPLRVVDGVPHRVDRLRTLGNAVVPQVAEWVGRRILEAA